MPLTGEQQWDIGVISQSFGATGKGRCVPTQYRLPMIPIEKLFS